MYALQCGQVRRSASPDASPLECRGDFVCGLPEGRNGRAIARASARLRSSPAGTGPGRAVPCLERRWRCGAPTRRRSWPPGAGGCRRGLPRRPAKRGRPGRSPPDPCRGGLKAARGRFARFRGGCTKRAGCMICGLQNRLDGGLETLQRSPEVPEIRAEARFLTSAPGCYMRGRRPGLKDTGTAREPAHPAWGVMPGTLSMGIENGTLSGIENGTHRDGARSGRYAPSAGGVKNTLPERSPDDANPNPNPLPAGRSGRGLRATADRAGRRRDGGVHRGPPRGPPGLERPESHGRRGGRNLHLRRHPGLLGQVSGTDPRRRDDRVQMHENGRERPVDVQRDLLPARHGSRRDRGRGGAVAEEAAPGGTRSTTPSFTEATVPRPP